MSEIKACKDCCYIKKLSIGDYCLAPNLQVELEPKKILSPCYIERADLPVDNCGSDAKYFTPRRPWWKRLLRIK